MAQRKHKGGLMGIALKMLQPVSNTVTAVREPFRTCPDLSLGECSWSSAIVTFFVTFLITLKLKTSRLAVVCYL